MSKSIGEHKLSEMLPHLQPIADRYGLRLNRVKEFKLTRMLLATRYYGTI